MNQTAVAKFPWWGRFAFAEGETRHWSLGASSFQDRRRESEWRIEYRAEDEDRPSEVGNLGEWRPAEGGKILRVAGPSDSSELEVVPVAADRSVVARPETALDLVSGQRLMLFVGHPAWIRIVAGSQPGSLTEFPSVRLSDTWFGSTTVTGQLAYATRTSARLSMQNIDSFSYRILTRVRLENRSDSQFHLERILLPTPSLSVFCDDAGQLRSEDVSVVLGEDDIEAAVSVARSRAEESGSWIRLSEPRNEVSDNIVARAMSVLRI